MSDVSLKQADNKIQLEGDLTHETVPAIMDRNIFAHADKLQVDLSGVKHSDSSGLALLIHWFRLANKYSKSLVFENVPPKMMALAKVCSLDKVLPFVSH